MDTQFQDQIQELKCTAALLPGVVFVHELKENEDFDLIYLKNDSEMSSLSQKDMEAFRTEYNTQLFKTGEPGDLREIFRNLIKTKDPEKNHTYFFKVFVQERSEKVWHMGSTRIFSQDAEGNPTHLVTLGFPIDHLKHTPNKAERIVAEINFFKENMEKFHSLGPRAKEVLKLVALGKSSSEISDILDISIETVNTHRKIIKKKLGINTVFEFAEYAQAYDLI